MKFGQDFQAALEREEYPRVWIESAISYKKLKKCIKRVREELLSFGLDQETLTSLWQHVGRSGETSSKNGDSERLLHYGVDNTGKIDFVPKLTILIDPSDGSPMDAWLSPETRQHLHRLVHSSKSNVTRLDNGTPHPGCDSKLADLGRSSRSDNQHVNTNGPTVRAQETKPADLETIEIPLASDSEFFQILRRELSHLDALQSEEQSSIQSEIVQLGSDLRDLKLSKKKRSKEELKSWRQIFELYTDTEIFLSSHEVDAGTRDVTHAQQQLKLFTETISSKSSSSSRFSRKFLGKDATIALDRFIQINLNLLRLMKFQDINRTALTKIMKKFDKQTALHARAAIPQSFESTSLLSTDLAKATCFTISQELIQIIPQLNDYLCPVCLSISYKPVRLSCDHVFCIRCLIVLQRAQQNQCPLCRSDVVLAADSDNIDKRLKQFLEENFKSEVKEKQSANELQVALERFGETHGKSAQCAVM